MDNRQIWEWLITLVVAYAILAFALFGGMDWIDRLMTVVFG